MKRLLWLLIPVFLSGCSGLASKVEDIVSSGPKSEGVKPAELVDIAQEVQVTKLWSTSALGDYQSVGSGLRPVINNGVIYAADSQGVVVALDASSGDSLWKVKLDTPLGGGVGIGGGLVLVGSLEGEVYALNLNTGEQLWVAGVSSEVLSAPAANDDIVVVQTQDGKAIGLNTTDGEKRWQFELDVPVLTIRGTSTPVIKGATVVVGFANGKVYALATDTGTMVWDNRVAIPQGRTELERLVDIDGQPLLVSDVIYAVSNQGRIGAMSRGTGRGIWYQDSSSHHGPAYGLEQVYVAETDDTVKAMRASSGQILWTNDQLTYRKLNRPSVAGGYLVLGDAEGFLHILSQTDGRFVGRVHISSSGISAPMASDGQILYVLGNGGSISAYKFE